MSKKRQRRLTIVGISTVLTVWIAALALLFSQPGAQSANHMLPTLAGPLEGVSSLPNTGGVSPTLLPTGLPVELPADSPPVSSSSNATQIQAPDSATTTLNIPSDPIPNSMVIRFKPEMTDQQRLDYIAALGGQIVQEIKPLNTVIINLPAKANAAAQAQTQRVNPGVVANEPDYYAGALLSPNDSLAAGQWGLNVVKAPQAWDLLPLPTPTITVAVIDSGICANHADLQGRIASDGWDFVQNDSTPQDEFGHGCAVSGIIAANSNNGLGIAGVAPNTAIMPLRVLDGSGIGRYSNVAAAIVYAVDNGAQVINMSLGGPNPSSILQDAVNYADAHGVTVIAAAGNAGTAQAYYPAAYPPVVAVGSVDQNLQRSAFSNYGPDVDLYAPGSNIMTTSLDGSFQTYSGTSVAAPYVTGVWALRKALGKSLVLDGGIVSAIYDNDVPAPTEQPPSEACVLTNFNEAESTYFDLVQQNATQPGSVSDDQLQTAKTTYLSVAGQCANALYDGTITIDGGALSPVGGDVAPQFQLFGHKWGSDSPFNPSRPPAAPVPPATPVTFSFMPTGVSLAEKEAENGGGPNAFITSIDQLPNNTTQCDLEGRIRQAFAAWSKVANISFVEIPQEARDATGAPIPFGHGAAGQVGDIRIGAQVIDGMKGELGHAYYPPPEDTDPASANIVRSGDIFLDRAEMWGCAPGETQINGETVRVIDIGLVALHEIGHALGMRHEAADQQLALMNPTYKAELLTPNDQFNLSDGIQPDDKSGIQGIYGALGVSAPTATFPVDNTDVNDNTPTFTWTDTTNNGSDYFEVQIYTNDGSNQAGGLVFDGTTDGDHPDAANPNAKAFTLQTVLESQSYVWRVRSFVTSDWGPWSTYQSFSVTVGIASLRRPVEGESLSNGTVNFEWSPIVGDNIFNLQIASRPEFSDPLLFEQDGIASTRFVLSTPLADGTYYWRVRGSNSNLFSRVGSFIVDSSAPVVDLSTGNGAVSPADDSSQPNQGVTLSWPTLSGIDEYQVQVDTSENFSGLLYLDRVFLDRVFLDRVFLDRVFLDRVFLDRVFLDR
ncbi:MAG: S8 family serine peptidase, partial [Chloroflexota bacterium]